MFSRKAQGVDLEDLHRSAHAIHGAADPDELVARLIEEMPRLVEAESISVFRVDPRWKELYRCAVPLKGVQSPESRDPGPETGGSSTGSRAGASARFPIGQGIAGWVAERGDPWRTNNLGRDPLFVAEIDEPNGPEGHGIELRSVLSLPLKGRNEKAADPKVLGVVQLCNAPGAGFTEDDEYYGLLLAEHAGLALEKSQRADADRTLVRSLAEAMARVVDAKHVQTVGHSDRVRRYALAIGRALKLRPEEMEGLELAALLHDLGRLEMSPTEGGNPNALEQARNHIFFTDAILRNVEFPEDLKDVRPAALAHHEKLDGTGYPKGLSGKRLGRLARILMVANTYDRLHTRGRAGPRPASSRSAGPVRGLSEAEACQQLQREAGSALDREIVDLFVQKKLYAIEKRRFPRVEYKTPLDVFLLGADGTEGKRISTEVLDLSEGGLMFYARAAPAPMSLVRLLIHLPSEQIEALAKVIRVLPDKDGRGKRVGVYFLWFDKLR